MDERRFHLLPDAVQSRLTAHGNQLIGGEEIDAFVHAMQGLAVPLPEIPTMKLPEQESLRMLVETQQAYVSSLTKVLAPGAGLFDPTVSVTTDRGVDLCCSVRNHADGSGSVVSGSAKVSRLVALIPVTQTMKIESLANPGKFQVVSGTYQLPVTAKYDLRFSGCAVPNGQALLVASLGQTLENAGTATTQPAITQANRDSIGQEEHEHVFLLLKPRLISIGVAP